MNKTKLQTKAVIRTKQKCEQNQTNRPHETGNKLKLYAKLDRTKLSKENETMNKLKPLTEQDQV